MDAVSEALCWASNTLAWEISNVKPPCWDGKSVQYKNYRFVDIPTQASLVDKINIDKIHYIASQHTGECLYDTIQNILMFADGFREIYAPFAKKLFIEHPKDLLYSTSTKDTSTRINKLISDNYKKDGIDDKVLNFLAATFRRYILIKLAENNISDQDIDKYINAQLLSSGSATLIKSNVSPPLGRNPSINGVAGPYLQWRGKQCMDTLAKNHSDVIDIFISSLFIIDKLTIEKTYKNIKDGTKGLIAAYIELISTDGNPLHVLGIIRNNGNYYIIDNTIGIAKQISDIDKYNGVNFSLEFTTDSFIYNFGNDTILKIPSPQKYKPEKITNGLTRFFYLNEG